MIARTPQPRKPSRKFRRLLAEYAQCYHAEAEKGGTDPESWEEIEQALAAAERKLFAYVAGVEDLATDRTPLEPK